MAWSDKVPFVLVAMGAVLAVGCGGNIEGRWTGECELASAGVATIWDVDLDIVDKGGSLSGEGELSSGYIYKGDLEGTRDGTAVNMTWEIESQGYLYEVELDGDRDKDRITGDCEIRGKSVNYLVQGDFEVAAD